MDVFGARVVHIFMGFCVSCKILRRGMRKAAKFFVFVIYHEVKHFLNSR